MLRKSDKVLERISFGSGWRSRNEGTTVATAQAAPGKALATLSGSSAIALALFLVASATYLDVAKTARAEIPRWGTPREVDYATGDAFRRALAEPRVFLREGVSVREAIVRTSETTGVAIWADRRVDPSVERAWRAEEETLESSLAAYALPSGAAVGRCGDVLYVGRPEVAARLEPTVERRRAEAAKAPFAQAAKLKAKRPFGWKPVSQPREIVQAIGQTFAIEVRGVEEIPLDLWPGAELPDSDAATQLSLVLAPFDATFVWEADGRSATIVPLPADETGVTAFTVKTAEEISPEVWKRRFPKLQFEKTDGILYAQGPWAELIEALHVAAGEKSRPTAAASTEENRRYDLRVENQPAGGVLKTLTEQWKLQVEFPPELMEPLRQRISLDVKQVDREALLDQVLDPVGLEYRLEGDKLILSEKPLPNGE